MHLLCLPMMLCSWNIPPQPVENQTSIGLDDPCSFADKHHVSFQHLIWIIVHLNELSTELCRYRTCSFLGIWLVSFKFSTRSHRLERSCWTSWFWQKWINDVFNAHLSQVKFKPALIRIKWMWMEHGCERWEFYLPGIKSETMDVGCLFFHIWCN